MLVFVYGTLKRGYGNNILLRNSDFLGEDTIEDHTLVLEQAFPYMVESKGDKVRGEVYEVDERTVRLLDSLEGYPHHYQKKEISTVKGRLVFTYYLDKKGPDPTGWIKHMLDTTPTGEAWGRTPPQVIRKEQ